MKKLLTLALLAAFGATFAGCSASMDVDPNHDSNMNKKTTTVKDANGNVIEKKTTETRNP